MTLMKKVFWEVTLERKWCKIGGKYRGRKLIVDFFL